MEPWHRKETQHCNKEVNSLKLQSKGYMYRSFKEVLLIFNIDFRICWKDYKYLTQLMQVETRV